MPRARIAFAALALTMTNHAAAREYPIELHLAPHELGTAPTGEVQDRIARIAREACNDSAATPPAMRRACRRDIAAQLTAAIAKIDRERLASR